VRPGRIVEIASWAPAVSMSQPSTRSAAEALDSTVSASALNATTQQEKRDMPQPCTPRSRSSCTLQGYSSGIMQAEKIWSDWCGSVDE
jgi:hypothetical protein